MFFCISRCTGVLCADHAVFLQKNRTKSVVSVFRKVLSILFGEAAFRQSCLQSYLGSSHHSREVVSSAVRSSIHYCWNVNGRIPCETDADPQLNQDRRNLTNLCFFKKYSRLPACLVSLVLRIQINVIGFRRFGESGSGFRRKSKLAVITKSFWLKLCYKVSVKTFQALGKDFSSTYRERIRVENSDLNPLTPVESEPVFFNVYGAPESIPRNNSAILCSLAGRYDNPLPPQFLAPIGSLKIPAQVSNLDLQHWLFPSYLYLFRRWG